MSPRRQAAIRAALNLSLKIYKSLFIRIPFNRRRFRSALHSFPPEAISSRRIS